MQRRSFFSSLGAFFASLFLPSIEVAKAKVRRLVNPTWRSGQRYWEHLAVAEPVAGEALSPDGDAIARRVCRVLSPAKSPPVRLGWDGWEGWQHDPYKTIHERIRLESQQQLLEDVDQLRTALGEPPPSWGSHLDVITYGRDYTFGPSIIDRHWADSAATIKGLPFYTLPVEQVTVAHVDELKVALESCVAALN